jgi:hypothetical protein
VVSGGDTSVGKETGCCHPVRRMETVSLVYRFRLWGGSALVPTEQVGSRPSPDPFLPCVVFVMVPAEHEVGKTPHLPRLPAPVCVCAHMCMCVCAHACARVFPHLALGWLKVNASLSEEHSDHA